MSCPPKDLYVASSLDQLNNQVQLPVSAKRASGQMLVETMQKIFNKAEEMRKTGDEESAYVLYMKFIALFNNLRIKTEYKEDPKYYEAMMDKSKIMKAMVHSESLSKSLANRYETKLANDQKKKEEEAEAEAANALEKRMALLGLSPQKTKNDKDSIAKNEDMGYSIMEPKQLYSLITEKATSFLLLDARPKSDYSATHIKHPYSLNIPDDILTAGSTPQALERKMPVVSQVQWGKRTNVDKLILLDWTSQQLDPKTPLEVLKDAMYRWDTANTYLCKKPYILNGGFENFAIRYPMEITNPSKARELAKNKLNGMTKQRLPSLSTVEYPDPSVLDKGFLITPSPSPKSTKSEAENPAIASGAITISRVEKPLIPDRGAKPKLVPVSRDDSIGLNEARFIDSTSATTMVATSSNSTAFNEGFIESESSEILATSELSKKNPPNVDRSLKAKVLLSRGRSDNDKLKKEVLEAEKDLAEDSFQLEKQELHMEQQWAMLRLKREKEAEEEMKEEMMKKEEALLEELNKLSVEKINRDVENEALRKQLNDLKARLDSQSDAKVTKNMDEVLEQRVAEVIRQRDLERKKLKAEVEEKRRERKLKLQEQLESERKRQLEIDEQKKKVLEAEHKRRQVEQNLRDKEAKMRNSGIIRQPLRDDSATSSFGDLSRSHSFPDLTQMLEEVPAPRFDRNIKPSLMSMHHARDRNFKPVWGTVKKGLTGLRNLGNTCYMNSVLQCLSNFTVPAQYFIDQIFKRDLNNNSDTKGEVAIEFSEVIRALWSGQYKSIAPVDLKRVVGKYMDTFRGSTQQDAHEFLTKLMDWLNDDLNEVRRKLLLPEVDFSKMNEIEAATSAWELQKKIEKSFIQETFFGQTRSTCQCRSCGYKSYKFEKFLGLTLVLPPGDGRCNLHQCIQDFLKEELVDYYCEKCKLSKKATKKLEIVRLPLILTVHLKRFYKDYDIDVWRKKENYVDFELSNFNVGQYATACGGRLNRYRNYQLYGVCNHIGSSMEGGHYTAYCYSQVYGLWHKYDDHEVIKMKESGSGVKTSAAYILFYSAKN